LSRSQITSFLPPLVADRSATPDEVAEFGANGHVCIRELASAAEVDAFAPSIERTALDLSREKRALEDRDTYGQAFLQVPNLWLADPIVKRFVLAERFARVAAELLGVERIRLYHDQALFKEPQGGYTPWHQDQFYWPLDTQRTITLWMPLADISSEVGSMRFASGAHVRGHLGGHAIGDESHRVLAELIQADGLDVVDHGAMTAGDATFHHGWTLHSAPPNPSGLLRSVMTIIYFEDGAKLTPLDHPNLRLDRALWLPGCEPGDAAATPFNPVLWPAPISEVATPKRGHDYWQAVAAAARELGIRSFREPSAAPSHDVADT
jgi:ectoine hydroxylase-related dioxygenase (phytanoyl-CoA dioxygenase family)